MGNERNGLRRPYDSQQVIGNDASSMYVSTGLFRRVKTSVGLTTLIPGILFCVGRRQGKGSNRGLRVVSLVINDAIVSDSTRA